MQRDFRILSLSLVKRYEFIVGRQEQHQVAIEHEEQAPVRRLSEDEVPHLP